mmetsp:Transcript_15231/g.30884  ORF Transcript_15231/g.30884 Transcript_15231/m.30884 type:complete len:173 (+) Transcript_15231:1113-1631(+)
METKKTASGCVRQGCPRKKSCFPLTKPGASPFRLRGRFDVAKLRLILQRGYREFTRRENSSRARMNMKQHLKGRRQARREWMFLLRLSISLPLPIFALPLLREEGEWAHTHSKHHKPTNPVQHPPPPGGGLQVWPPFPLPLFWWWKGEASRRKGEGRTRGGHTEAEGLVASG